MTCAILYTSRNKKAPNSITTYQVEQLPEEGALRLLLGGTRPLLLSEVLSGSQDAEAHAARMVCHGVGYLPLALIHLRGLLVRDQNLKLVRLAEVLKQRGALDITKTLYSDTTPLFATFYLSWERLHDEKTRTLFKLASYFPEAALIPLWLVGLAAGLGESGDIFEPLGEARMQLQESSLMEELSEGQVRLHTLVRAFGQRLVVESGSQGEALLREAGERLIAEFTNVNKLERRSLDVGYWGCLEQVRMALTYARLLLPRQIEDLNWIEQFLDRESYIFVDERIWPKSIPGLLYQQLYNRSVEEGLPQPSGSTPTLWLRQLGPVHREDQARLRTFTGHESSIMGIAFSPDGTKIVSGSGDQTIRLWDVSSGNLLVTLQIYSDLYSVVFSPDGSKFIITSDDPMARLWVVGTKKVLRVLYGHTDYIYCAAFSPDSRKIVTGSRDRTARLWEVASGKLLATFNGHKNAVVNVGFSPDGTKIATGSIDHTICLWEVASGKLLTTLIGHTNVISSIAFSPDSRFLMTGDNTDRVFLWLVDEPGCGRLIGSYFTHYRVLANHWYDAVRILVADSGGPTFYPHLYQLKLEGIY